MYNQMTITCPLAIDTAMNEVEVENASRRATTIEAETTETTGVSELSVGAELDSFDCRPS